MGTVDAHLVAVDAKNGHLLWDTTVAKAESGYALTHAPLVVKDKVIVGTPAASSAFAASLQLMTSTPGKKSGAFTLSLGPANQVARRGAATPGRQAALRSG